MARRLTWTEAYRHLGGALLELFWAEVAVVRYDFARFLKQVMVLLGAALLTLVLLIYTPFLILLTLVDATKRITGWESYWAPALTVLGLVLLAIGIFATVLYYLVVRKMNPPTTAIPRRLDDHRGWWQNNVGQNRVEPVPMEPAGGDSHGSESGGTGPEASPGAGPGPAEGEADGDVDNAETTRGDAK